MAGRGGVRRVAPPKQVAEAEALAQTGPPQTAVIPGPSLVASAVRMPGKSARIYVPAQPWQQEAYRHVGICGEARYAANYRGNALSKVKIYAANRTEDGIVRQPATSKASQVLDQLGNGAEGQSAMMGAIGRHLTIAGECYIVGREATGDANTDRQMAEEGQDIWEVVPVTEMKKAGDQWSISYGDGFKDVKLTEDDVVIRVWTPAPDRRMYADSPFRALLPVLAEIEWLTKNIFSQITSRLTGAGVLFLPQGMSFPPPPEVDGKPQNIANEAVGFTMTLGETMMQSLKGDGSPSEKVPLVVTAPDEALKNPLQWLTFYSDMDKATLEMRKDAVHRFALGMDMPPEKLLGMSSNPGTGGGNSNGVSHWGAWQIDEDDIKMQVEPLAEVIVSALAIGYLRPVTEDDSIVWYDASDLKLRPDRSQEAGEAYDRGELAGRAYRRENGFDEKDAPTPAERKEWLLLKIAGGSATPEQVAAAAAAFGVDLPTETETDVRESRPAPSLEDHPTRREPERDAAALLYASDALVYRALERAGNRLRQSVGKPPNCPSFETHTLVAANGNTDQVLDDAFSCAPQVLDGLADPDKVVPVLDAYCKSLLASQEAHSRPLLAKWLEKADLK